MAASDPFRNHASFKILATVMPVVVGKACTLDRSDFGVR